MKRDSLSHPKMLDLASQLNCSRVEAIGYMTLLCDFTSTYATQGDIGRHKNGAIARGCEWMGLPDVFVNALIESGWLDQCALNRLVLHDWPEHCEPWVKAKLLKLKLAFATVTKPVTTGDQLAVTEHYKVAIAETTQTTQSAIEHNKELITITDDIIDGIYDVITVGIPEPSTRLDKTRLDETGQDQTRLDYGVDSQHLSSKLDVSDVGRDVLESWNRSMNQSCRLTPKRSAAVRQRLRDPFFVVNWRSAIERVVESEFCQGGGENGWVADFEWFVRPETVTRLIEGKYGRVAPTGKHKTFAQQREENTLQVALNWKAPTMEVDRESKD